MRDYGCFQGFPHDLVVQYENPAEIHERCKICGKRYKWNKDLRGRVDNKRYLEAHARDFAQPTGATAQLFYALYQPELYEQNRHLWTIGASRKKGTTRDLSTKR